MTRLIYIFVCALYELAVLAAAEAQVKQQPSSSVERSLVAAVQQIIASTDIYVTEMERQLKEKDAVIVELREKCGDPCKPEPPPPMEK